VETENLMTGNIHHTATAYLTFVALDKSGRPMTLPSLILKTEEEQRQKSGGKNQKGDAAERKDEGKRQVILIKKVLYDFGTHV